MAKRKIFVSKKIKRKIMKYRLIDDVFFMAFFNGNKELTEFLLKILLDTDDLTVVDVKVQKEYKNLQGRSIILDILARDTKGRVINVEIQRTKSGAIPKRARFHSSIIDSNAIRANQYFDKLPEAYVIFITETDIYGYGQPIYEVDRYIKCKGGLIEFNDEAHIIYVNGENKDDTALGHLMQDFFCSKADDMYYNELSERMRFLKESERGNEIMSMSMQELIDEGAKKGTYDANIKTAKRLLKLGKNTIEEIAECTGLSEKKVKSLAEKANKVVNLV